MQALSLPFITIIHYLLSYSMFQHAASVMSLFNLQAVVDAPSGNEPVGLDMLHMGKGLAWLNGESIGIYFPVKSSEHDECVKECNYRGKFSPNKCSTGCGEPTQRW